tara:strand:+ start:2887 stop:5415 length:2529 start_codon:yes stop_codon:yes gene_type:complete
MSTKFFNNSEMISPLSDQYSVIEKEKHYHSRNEQLSQCSFVSNEFVVEDITGKEEIRISALGLYKCFINNKCISEDVLTPGWVNYNDRLPYQTYNISSLLKKGVNKIEVWLADGWFRGPLMSLQTGLKVSNIWGTKIGTIIEIRNENNILLSTNKEWKSGLLPILKSGIYFGESFDSNYISKITDGVEVLEFEKSLLVEHEIEAVKELDEISVKEEFIDDEGNTVYDFGQNIAGYVSIIVKGEKGSKIIIEHSEVMGLSTKEIITDSQEKISGFDKQIGEAKKNNNYKDKADYQKNLQIKKNNHFENKNFRLADAKIEYILSGKDEEHYKPSFTFMGFRYARVKILNGSAEIKKIISIPISSLSRQKLEFSCANNNVNKLIQNTSWSQKANFIEVPTDCPQRDERLGWTGDAQLFASTACYFFDCENFFIKYLRDLVSEQDSEGAIGHVSPDITRNGKTNDKRYEKEDESSDWSGGHKGATGWGDVIVILPWIVYKHYGNKTILNYCQKAMIKWCDYLWSISNGPIIRNPRSPNLFEGIKLRGFTFGDWVPPIGDDRTPNPHIGDDCYSTIYHFISTSLLSKISKLLGDENNSSFFEKRSNEIKEAFANEFITPSGRLAYSDQTSYAMSFVNNLIPEEKREEAKKYFKQTIIDQNYRLGTGFHGTANLLKGLRKAGLEDMIEKVLLQEDLPGWMYQIKQGATSIWERWNAMADDGSIHDPEMNSFNHYAFGSVCEFIFENIVGVSSDENNPGFKNIIIEPMIIPSFCPISFKHESKNGLISVKINIENEIVVYDIEIPKGTSGKLILSKYKNIKVNNINQNTDVLIINEGRNIINFSLPKNK